MLLYEKPPETELEVVTFWVNSKRRPWALDDADNPVDPNTGAPYPLDKNGLPVVERVELKEGEQPPELPERLRFWLKMLLGKDTNEIASAGIKINRAAGRRRRRGGAQVSSDVQVNVMTTMKLKRAITKWEGVEFTTGKLAAITEINIGLLPGWIQDDLADVVSDISALTEEEKGE